MLPLEPDPGEVVVFEQRQDGIHPAVELLDGLLLDAFDFGAQLLDSFVEGFPFRLKVVFLIEPVFDSGDVLLDAFEVVLQGPDVVFQLIGRSVKVQNLLVGVVLQRFDFGFDGFDFLLCRIPACG